MEQVWKTALLWMLGSRNPAADCTRIRQGRPIIGAPTPQAPVYTTVTMAADGRLTTTESSSAGLGRGFEDRVIRDMLPTLASRLAVTPPSRLYRITRHIPHSGDLAIHYRDKVGILELKNHTRALPVTDRRRFFDSILVHYKNIDWAILATSRCSVPHFADKGYTVAGRVIIDVIPNTASRIVPVAFICGLDILGVEALEGAVHILTERIATSSPATPQWKMSELITKGDASRVNEAAWGTGETTALRHPPGAVFH